MGFREQLPVRCPPSNNTSPANGVLYRLLKAPTYSNADFDSQRKKFPKRPYPDECAARAISLVTTLGHCLMVVKSPRMAAFTHALQVSYDPTQGVWDQDNPRHVNWWLFDAANPPTGLGAVIKL